jgi:integrase
MQVRANYYPREFGSLATRWFAGGSTPKNPIALGQEFQRCVGGAKELPQVTFHGLRHSHAAERLRNGVPLKVVSERLGHSSIRVTAALYSHVDAAMDADAAAKLDAAFDIR